MRTLPLLLVAILSLFPVDLGAQSETSDNQLFIQKEVNLRQSASIDSTSLGLVEPGTLATRLEDAPVAGFVHIRRKKVMKDGWPKASWLPTRP